MIDRMLLFGATGDLAGRHLLPALARMLAGRALSSDFRVIGSGRESWDDRQFRAHVESQLAEHADDLTAEVRGANLARAGYRVADFAGSSQSRV